ncbi:MAG: hypothetical protein H2069_00150 [Legionella sp.]|nr:hypothetical protein [Legionella sp.]
MTHVDITDQQSYLHWLRHWFQKHHLYLNDRHDFFEQGALSSLETVSLILDIEKQFNGPLPEYAFSDPRFSTIAGLASILSELYG